MALVVSVCEGRGATDALVQAVAATSLTIVTHAITAAPIRRRNTGDGRS